jgi:hypothetical protein
MKPIFQFSVAQIGSAQCKVSLSVFGYWPSWAMSKLRQVVARRGYFLPQHFMAGFVL